MPQVVFIVAYDGMSRTVVDFAVEKAKREGARLYIVDVIEWTPFKFLTPDELAVRHVHLQAELALAGASVLPPILDYVRALGVAADGEVRNGDAVDTLTSIATEQDADMIFCGRTDKLSAPVVGSVASGLVQCAPLPVVIVP